MSPSAYPYLFPPPESWPSDLDLEIWQVQRANNFNALRGCGYCAEPMISPVTFVNRPAQCTFCYHCLEIAAFNDFHYFQSSNLELPWCRHCDSPMRVHSVREFEAYENLYRQWLDATILDWRQRASRYFYSISYREWIFGLFNLELSGGLPMDRQPDLLWNQLRQLHQHVQRPQPLQYRMTQRYQQQYQLARDQERQVQRERYQRQQDERDFQRQVQSQYLQYTQLHQHQHEQQQRFQWQQQFLQYLQLHQNNWQQ